MKISAIQAAVPAVNSWMERLGLMRAVVAAAPAPTLEKNFLILSDLIDSPTFSECCSSTLVVSILWNWTE